MSGASTDGGGGGEGEGGSPTSMSSNRKPKDPFLLFLESSRVAGVAGELLEEEANQSQSCSSLVSTTSSSNSSQASTNDHVDEQQCNGATTTPKVRNDLSITTPKAKDGVAHHQSIISDDGIFPTTVGVRSEDPVLEGHNDNKREPCSEELQEGVRSFTPAAEQQIKSSEAAQEGERSTIISIEEKPSLLASATETKGKCLACTPTEEQQTHLASIGGCSPISSRSSKSEEQEEDDATVHYSDQGNHDQFVNVNLRDDDDDDDDEEEEEDHEVPTFVVPTNDSIPPPESEVHISSTTEDSSVGARRLTLQQIILDNPFHDNFTTTCKNDDDDLEDPSLKLVLPYRCISSKCNAYHRNSIDSFAAATISTTEQSNTIDRRSNNSFRSSFALARKAQDQPQPTPMQEDDVEEANAALKDLKPFAKTKVVQRILVGIVFILFASTVFVGAIFGLSTTGKKEQLVVPTAAPSESPSSARPSGPGVLDLLRESLPGYTLESLESNDSPQWKAWNWLTHHQNISNLEEWRKKQLFALGTFYYSFVGENWNERIEERWMDETKEECLWFSSGYQTGRSASDSLLPPCNDGQQFTALELDSLELGGLTPSMPPEIALLTSLSTIWLDNNGINTSLSAMLPPELYQLTNMTYMVFDANSLVGPIPSELGLMTSLTELGLGSNSLFGWIPTEVGSMTSLSKFNLKVNSFSGHIPSEMGGMTSMVDLRLSSNALSGPIPPELGLMSSLSRLYLLDNALDGPIPSEVGGMTSMVDFAVFMNALTGTIPSDLGLTSAMALGLSENALTGSLPSQLGALTSMVVFWIQSNALTGQLPTELGLMTSLTDLKLYDNSLTGQLPTELGLMTSTVHFWVSNNHFTGSLPSELGRMTRLVGLKAEKNALTGQLPTELGLMTSMTALWVDRNRLNGSIPSQLALMTNLEQIRLENNTLTGTIPLELELLVLNGSLTALTLSNNSFSGTIPEGLCSLGVSDTGIGGAGLSFDCNDQFCGCSWCPCPDINNSTEFQTGSFVPSRDDKEWPGIFPIPVNTSNVITINIRTDGLPEETSFTWSMQDVSGRFRVLATRSPPAVNSLHSYTIGVVSNSIYSLKIFDTHGDGACCEYGYGWFTVTNSIPSDNHKEGTVIWEATGDFWGSLDVFLWIDQNGKPQLVEYIPGAGYALLQKGDAVTMEEYVFVIPETVTQSSSGEALDDSVAP